MLRKLFSLVLIGAGVWLWSPGVVRAVVTPQSDSGISRVTSESDYLEARQYRIVDARVAGNVYARQTVTAWQVTQGSWEGQALDGLSLVLVQTIQDDGQSAPSTNCYISHFATPAQRMALLSAFQASRAQSSDKPLDLSSMRVEPAIITLEFNGHSVVLHIGTIAEHGRVPEPLERELGMA